jgi:hypothetical protein
VVGSGISNNQQARLDEVSLDLIGECSRGVTSSHGGSSSIFGELQDSTLSVGLGRNNTNISGVLNGSNNTGSQDKLLPSLLEINDVDSFNIISVK